MKALVFTPTSLSLLMDFEISPEWFKDYYLPPESHGLKRIIVDDIAYIIDQDLDQDEIPIVVVNLSGNNPVFIDRLQAVNVIDRIDTVARSIFTDSVQVPVKWVKYHHESLASIYASPKNVGVSRLNYDTHPNREKSLFILSQTQNAVNLEDIDKQTEVYKSARKYLAEAILTEVIANSEGSNVDNDGLLLSPPPFQEHSHGWTLETWYTSKLTKEQRSFVDKAYDGPVRLRGAAGTGKTLALIIKMLRDGYQAENAGKKLRLGFITHSTASVDMVFNIAKSLDPHGVLISGKGKFCEIEINTLYQLADKHLCFKLRDIKPVSLDSREGREYQFSTIEDVLKEMGKSTLVTARFSGAIDPSLEKQWLSTDSEEQSRLIIELMNEFASVIDAENIRRGDTKGDDYVNGKSDRPKWLMSLPSKIDREFVLAIHQRYTKSLDDQKLLSIEGMVTDFNDFLDGNAWRLKRPSDGYDAIFIDELHLFTSIERLSLHKLIVESYEDEENTLRRRPPMFMAYDLKQSPNDVFTSIMDGDRSQLFSAKNKLQKAELVKLTNIFRYTPQISDFLRDLDSAFPFFSDMSDEWQDYDGISKIEGGNVPEIIVYPNKSSLFDDVVEKARKIAKGKGKRKVAVLCASEEMFRSHVEAVQSNPNLKESFLLIEDRESSSELRNAKNRFILSMPEYVAGLQFDTVFLTHIDVREAPLDSNFGSRRRFISNVYLGASRAEKTLVLSSCRDRGGISDILGLAMERKNLKETPYIERTR